jgi:hypothetical protein
MNISKNIVSVCRYVVALSRNSQNEGCNHIGLFSDGSDAWLIWLLQMQAFLATGKCLLHADRDLQHCVIPLFLQTALEPHRGQHLLYCVRPKKKLGGASLALYDLSIDIINPVKPNLLSGHCFGGSFL